MKHIDDNDHEGNHKSDEVLGKGDSNALNGIFHTISGTDNDPSDQEYDVSTKDDDPIGQKVTERTQKQPEDNVSGTSN